MSSDEAMISFNGVSKAFGGKGPAAVNDLTLQINRGEMVVLVGPSGCGKTTSMKMVNRLIEPSAGVITVNGADVMMQDPVRLRRGIGYVIQSVGLLPHRTVAQNIGTVPALVGWERTRIDERVAELAGLLELDPAMLPRYPAELSGGQRQRVGVARALALDPPVMLMDEPFGAVDPIVRGRLQDQFLDLQDRLQKTIVFVTHDIDEAIKMADRIAILNTGAHIEQYAPPEEILRSPAGEFVKEFVGPERGLKRLGLLKVGGVELEKGPVISPLTSTDEALRIMADFSDDWATVIDGDRLLGWVDKESVARVGPAQAEPQRFGAYVTEASSLREALDSVVTSKTQVAVVAGDHGQYLGILSLDRISKEIVS